MIIADRTSPRDHYVEHETFYFASTVVLSLSLF